jgi:hypothetical protein
MTDLAPHSREIDLRDLRRPARQPRTIRLQPARQFRAIRARPQVLFHRQRFCRRQVATQIADDALLKPRASHNFPFSSLRNFSRAVQICDRTVVSDDPRIRATS